MSTEKTAVARCWLRDGKYCEFRRDAAPELLALLRASWDDPDYRARRPKLWGRVEALLAKVEASND